MLARCGLAAAVWLAVLAPPASAGWLAQQPLSAPGQQAINPALALGPDGTAVGTWMRFDGSEFRAEVAVRPPGGTLEGAQILSAPGSGAITPRPLVDAAGNALVLWEEGRTIRWAERPAGAAAFADGGTLTLPGNESAFSDVRLAAAPDGTVAGTVVTGETGISSSHTRVRTITRAPGGDFVLGAVLDEGVSVDGGDSYTFGPPDMDADAQGAFYATWTKRLTSGTSTTSSVNVAVRSPGAAIFATESVASGAATSGSIAGEPIVAAGASGVDGAGNLTVAYIHTIDDPLRSDVRIRSRPAGGAFTPGSEPVTPTAQPAGPIELAYDVNGAGAGILAWRRGSGASAAIEACGRPAGGPCGALQPLATGSVFTPVASIGEGGAMVAAWRRTVGAAEASFARAGGVLGPPHGLASGVQVVAPREAVDVDPLGNAVIAVDHFTGGGVRLIRAVVNDSAAPSISPSSPATGQPGESLAFGANVLDVWSPVTSIWDFGDGSTAAGPAAGHIYPNSGVYAASITATDSEGNSATRAAPVRIADTIAPAVRSFGVTNRVFAVGRRSTASVAQRRRVPRGTAFRFRLTEGGSARITIERARPGRRLRGRCRKPSTRLRARPRCKRWVRVGALQRRVGAGTGRVKFSGRMRGRALVSGAHRAVLVVTDAAGNSSRPARVRFRVARR